MNSEDIARVAHEVNRAYCQSIGDATQTAWEDAPQWQCDSAVAGVEMHLANPDATPEDSHASWLATKEFDGWKYGPVKDAEKKEHPCFLPYDQLPAKQKSKDYLFRAVVHALAAYVSDQESEAVITVAAPLPGMTPVKYVGHRRTYREAAYGSGIEFVKGGTILVPDELAAKLLRHSDVYVRGEAERTTAAASPAAKVDTEDEKNQDLRDNVATMDKAALERFALQHFKVNIDKRKGVDSLRQQVTGLIDQFGID